ncbi:MAG TPA: hypothetical protein VFW63_13170 [Acidimicrobiales bacterium]|nr:hypothetical protein [Acidimicrobiales bacterium]
MNFGNDTPEAQAHLRRQLCTIDVIAHLAAEVRIPPESGSDLQVLVDRVGLAPVHLGRGIQNYLRTSLDCLILLRGILSADKDTSTVVLQSLLRPVLMTAGRVVFILGPNDRDSQFERAMTVLRQEGESFLRALNAFSTFESLRGLRPPLSLIADVESEMSAIRASGPPRGEGQVLDEMARGIAEVAARYVNNDEAGALGESVRHAWHTFSGGAHGYVWPDSVPGDFIFSLGVVVPVAHWAVDLAVRRTQV